MGDYLKDNYVDTPLEQWIWYRKEAARDGKTLHKHPWCVYVGHAGIIRARFRHEGQAAILVNRLKAAFDNSVLFIPSELLEKHKCEEQISTGIQTKKSSRSSPKESRNSGRRVSTKQKSRRR